MNGDKVSVRTTKYQNISGEATQTTNESAVRYLLQKLPAGQTISRIFILAFKAVREDFVACRGNYYLDANGNKLTHLEYFKARMNKFLDSESCIPSDAVYNYDENNSESQNLMNVAQIAGNIQKFANQTAEKVILHVDLTGGMRHINMMMLDVMRLLEYSGIKVEHLLYSNYDSKTPNNTAIKEVKNIYDLFQLISCVEEFVSFGSVKILDEYYKNQSDLSPKLKNLINSMKKFANEIKLCHYGQFKIAIEELHDALYDFEPTAGNLQDTLMDRLIGKIRHNYFNLIKTLDLDDISVIKWCVDNGYIQQALTLYTERIPEYIGNNGFIKLSDNGDKKMTALVDNDTMSRNKWFYILTVYESPNDHTAKFFKTYCSAIKDGAITNIKK